MPVVQEHRMTRIFGDNKPVRILTRTTNYTRTAEVVRNTANWPH